VSSLFRTPSRRKPVDKTADQTARSPVQPSIERWKPDSRAPARAEALMAVDPSSSPALFADRVATLLG